MDTGESRRVSKTEDNDEEEEVTETRVVGVTESGVLRKRSVKRKVTKEEKSKLRGYGNSRTDYDAIISRILDQKMVRDSIDTLKERLKMVVLMRDDCMELVTQWETIRAKQRKQQQVFDFQLFVFVLGGFSIIIVCWVLVRWYW